LRQRSKQLSDFVEGFAGQLGRAKRRHWCKVYLTVARGPAQIDSAYGRARRHVRPADPKLKPQSAQALAQALFAKPCNIRHCTLAPSKPVMVQYGATRVYETVAHPDRRVGPARWLRIARLGDGALQYDVSNLPASTAPARILRLAGRRWTIEQGYEQLKAELGLEHVEGRSWQGLHHHLMFHGVWTFAVATPGHTKNAIHYRRCRRCAP
jgi:hypothetical protein